MGRHVTRLELLLILASWGLFSVLGYHVGRLSEAPKWRYLNYEAGYQRGRLEALQEVAADGSLQPSAQSAAGQLER